MSLDDDNEFKDVGLIAFDEGLVKKVLAGVTEKKASKELEESWNNPDIDRETKEKSDYKPTMLVVNKSGTGTVLCGAHRSRFDAKTKDMPVNRYI